jgi:hypothetical protein
MGVVPCLVVCLATLQPQAKVDGDGESKIDWKAEADRGEVP